VGGGSKTEFGRREAYKKSKIKDLEEQKLR
jgi:hypothetical protein